MPSSRPSHPHPAIVLGSSLTSLGIIRSLGRRGVEVLSLDYQLRPIASYSKYCKYLKCPNPLTNDNELVTFLKSLRDKFLLDPVLLFTNDEFTLFLSRRRKELSSGFKFLLPPEDLVELLNDKRRFCNFASSFDIPTPVTFSPATLTDIEQIVESTIFPCVIKPAYGYLYNRFKFKGIIAKNPSELFEHCKGFADCLRDLVIQEVIPGDDNLQFSVAAYCNERSTPLATFVSRKIRQNPPGFGTGTFVISWHEPHLERTAVSFLEKINYRGIAELEFKRDERDGVVKMIEVNTRFWVQNNLATICGIDLPYIAYSDIVGAKVGRHCQSQRNVKWINVFDDFQACFSSAGYFKKGKINPWNWLISLAGEKQCATLAIDDMRPFITSLFSLTLTLPRRFRNKVINTLRFSNRFPTLYLEDDSE